MGHVSVHASGRNKNDLVGGMVTCVYANYISHIVQGQDAAESCLK